MKKLLVVDGNSILNRAFYGIRLLTNQEGLYTNAVYGMVTMVSRYMESIKPDYCAVAFDLKAPTFRHEMYDGYKANRSGMPEELAVQVPYAKDCMRALGFSVLSLEGYEADDILDTFRQKRAAALYREDESKPLRASHKNPQIIKLYADFLGEPNSHKAHELLHTMYASKEKFPD